jgi:putative endonuclease
VSSRPLGLPFLSRVIPKRRSLGPHAVGKAARGIRGSPPRPTKLVIATTASPLACRVASPRMRDHTYFVYIMASRSHTLYIGMTGNLHKRVFEHKWREHDGFTARYNCDRLVWFEPFREVGDAILREKELKGWRREKKIRLIEAANCTWVDLAREWYDSEPADLKRALG